MKKIKPVKNSENKMKFQTELTGLILVLISVIGIGSFGAVGYLIKSFSIFLMGSWWALLIILFLALGAYMIVKREMPKFMTARLIGFYILIIVLLSFFHLDYIKEGAGFIDSIKNTIDNILNTVSDNHYLNISSTGGGLIGSLFAWAFIKAFDINGTYISFIILVLFGLVMFLEVSFIDMFSSLKRINHSIKNRPKKEKKIRETKEPETIVNTYEEYIEEETKEIVLNPETYNFGYTLPPLDILDRPKQSGKLNTTEFINANKAALEQVLNDFQIIGKVVEIHEGPAVTQYEVEVKAATKLNRITSIHKEIALALAAKDVRIIAPIPGKSTVGIEIPNKQVAAVPIREVFSTIPKSMQGSKILVALGKDIMGETICADLNKMPHLLVAGATGSGKSVCINSFIASILMYKRPDEVKLVLIDPKKVELSNYNGVPHLLTPVVTNPKKANVALQKIVAEMDERYQKFEDAGAKNIASYNEMIMKNNKKNNSKQALLPYIVVIIDELADLMLVAAKEVEDSIMRITQMARAAGIHLIVATQRPSTDIITGVVKANIPSRIAFTVASYIDSRTILDQTGAEKLLGRGDMLYLPMGQNHPLRIQGTFISDDEIEKLIKHVSKGHTPLYDETFLEPVNEGSQTSTYGSDDDEDSLYNEILEFTLSEQKISASLIQRRFRVGYNRAARILDSLEENGIIGPPNGSKPREVLSKKE